jgi:hypothetical protein
MRQSFTRQGIHMKNFYEMLMLLEDDQDQGQKTPEVGLGNEVGQEPDQSAQKSDNADQDTSRVGNNSGKEHKHYMFFSNLKAIKAMAEEMLAMDAAKIDEMLADGHDWAADHVATSKDDIEEVHNWLSGEMG